MPKHTAHRELTDPENEKVLGTLTQRAWKMLNAKSIKARWYADYEGETLAALVAEDNVSELLFHQAIQTSGSIGGQHRRDLTTAIVGAPPPSHGVSVNMAQPQEQRGEAPEKSKRGF